jgi:hypothetical protein
MPNERVLQKKSKTVRGAAYDASSICESHGAELKLVASNMLMCEGCRVGGYFDSGNGRVAVAAGLSDFDFVSTLWHEIGHLEQFLDKSSYWHDKNVESGLEVCDLVEKGRLERPSDDLVLWANYQYLLLEWEADKNALNHLVPSYRRFGLTKTAYVKEASAYYYLFLSSRSCGLKKLRLGDVEKIKQFCPSRLLLDPRGYFKIPKEIKKIIKKRNPVLK